MAPALQIEDVDSTGYFLEDLGVAKILNHYHKFYFYFNTTNIELSYRNLLSNSYILEIRNQNQKPPFSLVNLLKTNCIQIEEQLAKFNSHRNKRALINGLGTAIRFITGNLDQNDLKEINNNLNILFANQEKVLKQMSKYSSFANHITNRYSADLNIIKQNINTSLLAITKINDRLNDELLIQYNIFLSQKLLETIYMIQRAISLALNNFTDLEIISFTELKEIFNHLKFIYKTDELLELDETHLFEIIKFSKMAVISTKSTITCVLYIPVLNPNPYNYQRIYPVPDEEDKILVPPAKYRLLGIREELWTNERCATINKQVLCVNKAQENECLLNDNNYYIKHCNSIVAKNNYKLIVQLSNNKVLAACKNSLKIVEECKGRLFHYTLSKKALVSSNDYCRIMINNVTYENSFSNFTYEVPKIHRSNFKFVNKYINLDQKHLDDIPAIKNEARELNENIELHPLVHITHFSVTSLLLLLLCSAGISIYVFRRKIFLLITGLGSKAKQEEEVTIQLEDVQSSSSTPQVEDALS